MFQNTVFIKIKGKNIERFLKRLINNNIELLSINYINYKEIIVEVKKEDYEKILDIKTVYEVNLLGIKGIDLIKQKILKKRYIIFSLICSFLLFYFLCNTIFSIEVIHNNKELRNIILNELEDSNIKKYKQKVSYDKLQTIKENILEKYKDKIEWLEIEEVGTKYIIKVEERIINQKEETYQKRNIVAKKDSLIIRIDAKSGEVIKNKNDYVKKGDTIISGDIYLYENIKNSIMADGNIYGEVWYKATVEYPLNYHEEVYTGRVKKVFKISFLNFKISLFDFHPYKEKNIKENVLIKHLFLPIKLSIDEEREKKVKNEKLTKNEAIKKAINIAKDKMNAKLKEKEYIIDVKKLKVEENYSKIIIDLFFSVCEDITDYKEITEIE